MAKKYRILFHIIIWILLFINSFFSQYPGNILQLPQRGNDLLIAYALIFIGYLIIDIVVFYTTVNLIAPLFLKYKKWFKGLLSSFLLFTLMIIYRYFLEKNFFLPFLKFDNYGGWLPPVLWYIKNAGLNIFFSYFAYGFLFYLVNDRLINTQKQKELEKEKLTAELSFLKSQINPHFLFNTLNDIYSLTYQQSIRASEAVLKLSALLRYMLKESDEKFVGLESEIKYLKDVIELHQIGQKGEAYINFDIEGSTKNDQKIAPLILINFVENSFKHGVFNDSKHPIQIFLKINDHNMLFKIANRKNNTNKDKTTGIGLNNVKRRLSLIYPDKYNLEIDDNDNNYTVKLKLDFI